MSDSHQLDQAAACLRRQDAAGAARLCESVLRRDPENARAWHLAGIAQGQLGDLEQAAERFEHAVAHDETRGLHHYHLGLARKGLGQLEAAADAYRHAIDRDPDLFEAHVNLGNTLSRLGRHEQARDRFRDVVSRFPDQPAGHFNLANLLQDAGQTEEAIALYREAIRLDAEMSVAWENLGRTLLDSGRLDEARQVWEQWLESEPGNPVATHHLASLTDEAPPPRCSDQYIRNTFDRTFAESYDAQLTGLDYRGPELIEEALRDLLASQPERASGLTILDAGCGTGLLAPVLRPLASRFVGVDLSAAMLEEARRRGTYDATAEQELVAYLNDSPERFDGIVAADTLCYFGDVDEVFAAVKRALNRAGWFIATFESAPEPEAVSDSRAKCSTGVVRDDYELQANGRYRHREGHLREQLAAHGLILRRLHRGLLRRERGAPVDGLVITASVED